MILVFPQCRDAAFVDTEFLVRYNLFQVYLTDNAKPLAVRTSPLRGVKREVVWSWVRIADAGSGTHQTLGVMFDCSGVLVKNENQTFSLLHGNGYRLLQTLFILSGNL